MKILFRVGVVSIYQVGKSVIYAKFRLTFLHKPCDITILRRSLCDISGSDVTINAALGCYVTNHATSSIVDLTWLVLRPIKWILLIDYIIIELDVTNNATWSIVDLTWLASRPMKWLLLISYIIKDVRDYFLFSKKSSKTHLKAKVK